MGIELVRYLIIPKIAKSPSANPIWSFTLASRKHKRKIRLEIRI
jgi:hypothetical protein